MYIHSADWLMRAFSMNSPHPMQAINKRSVRVAVPKESGLNSIKPNGISSLKTPKHIVIKKKKVGTLLNALLINGSKCFFVFVFCLFVF